ncbi:MAG: hypothetical protein A3C84_04190 [Candidatus Ryanbacteria bacterium RIFCSPHIGHO2_02_FULL_48_12]|uniref:Uncharacterized protein n=1 Tax=Candidatus Ryanbacteria bacterium RIFCSPHIGHO2_01_FULL_48_27 TaxID=1802115 RepID=A0A1G2G5J8_9BACT|nr:MAG: hypothetical protein A2756_00765 [Candidatus Ryanbacteria bacterium RIFCSPHIGHO2_01_FULL_48_27]OGZ48563.1 MAG: hypothetical protein A3C84_04190 [Candidatus Ryanbacteria bacterium RIFCSPHIGHO2_02_FULL_48_12]
MENKPKNQYKLNKQTLRIFLFFLTPLLVTLYLYPFKEETIFKGGLNRPQADLILSNVDLLSNAPTFKNFIANAISLPLSLDWYEVSIVNNSYMEIPGCLELESSITSFSVKGYSENYYSNLNSFKDVGVVGAYGLRRGERAFFVVSSSKPFSINGGLIMGGGCKRLVNVKSNPYENRTSGDFYITYKPYWVAWFARFFVICLFWIFLFSSLLAVKNWMKGNS